MSKIRALLENPQVKSFVKELKRSFSPTKERALSTGDVQLDFGDFIIWVRPSSEFDVEVDGSLPKSMKKGMTALSRKFKAEMFVNFL